MAIRAYGVSTLEFAPITADGSLPSTGWVKVVNITDGSVTITVPEVQTNDIRVEDVAGIVDVLPGDTDPVTLEAASIDIDGQKIAMLLGGTWEAGTNTYNAPAHDEIKHLAVRLTSRPHMGKQFQFFIKDAAIISNISANVTRSEMISFGFTARSTTPFDEDGNPVSPWGFSILDVTPTT